MRADVAIIGAGLAGAATAFHLTRAGVRSVLLLEREPVPGAHASGRNAGLIRQAIEDPLLTSIAVESAAALRGLSRDGAPVIRTTGSLLLAGPATQPHLSRVAEPAGARHVPHEEARRLAPELAGAPLDAAWYTPTDGVADVHALLMGFLEEARGAGARLLTECEVTGLRAARGRVVGLETSLGPVEAPAVVDAAGAWAGTLLRSAGVTPPPLQPYRRHLFQSGGAPSDASRPWVWNVESGFYFRAESGGYLLSACDQDPHPPAAPTTVPERAGDVAAKLAALAPALGGLSLRRSWACLRTFAPDGRFVLGPEPALAGFHYAAGLGGHGVTTSFVVGSLVARSVLSREGLPKEFARARFNS